MIKNNFRSDHPCNDLASLNESLCEDRFGQRFGDKRFDGPLHRARAELGRIAALHQQRQRHPDSHKELPRIKFTEIGVGVFYEWDREVIHGP